MWATSATTATTCDSWYQWTSSATTTCAATTWECWTTSDSVTETVYYRAPVYSDEETAEQKAAREERRRIRQQEDEKRLAETAAAEAKANELLASVLDDEQRTAWERSKKFHVIGSDGVRYEVDCKKRQHNVFALDETGKRVQELCLVQTGGTPLGDHLACQKLLLESDAEMFRRVANKWDLDHVGSRRLVA